MPTNFPEQAAVYWFYPGSGMGAEIRKIRPCVIVSPNEMNRHLQTVIVVPLTSTIQPWPFRLTIKLLGQQSSMACDQLQSIDKRRLKAHIGNLAAADRAKLFQLFHTILSAG